MIAAQSSRILELAQRQPLLSAAEVRAHGWSSQLLLKLHEAGKLQRVARGIYSLPGHAPTEHQALVEVCQRVPKAVICLLSALQFHGIGTQLPHEVWIALPESTKAPVMDYPPLRVSRLRGEAYTQGIETVLEQGAPIRVYSLAKTIADCFKFRNKIGLDVAMEALKEGWRERKLNIDDVIRFAEINRVAKVMQPYLQTAVA